MRSGWEAVAWLLAADHGSHEPARGRDEPTMPGGPEVEQVVVAGHDDECANDGRIDHEAV